MTKKKYCNALECVLSLFTCKSQPKKKNLSRLSAHMPTICGQSISGESTLQRRYVYMKLKKKMAFHANTLTDKPIVYSNKCNHQAFTAAHVYIERKSSSLIRLIVRCFTNVRQFYHSFLLVFFQHITILYFNGLFVEHEFLIAKSVRLHTWLLLFFSFSVAHR